MEGGASGEEGLGANGAWGRENGAATEWDRQPLEGETGKETEGETGGGAQPKEEEEEEEEEEQEEGEEEEDAPLKPFVVPSECGESRDVIDILFRKKRLYGL